MFCCLKKPVSFSCSVKIILAAILVLGALAAVIGEALHRRSNYTLEYCQFRSCGLARNGKGNQASFFCPTYSREVTISTNKECKYFRPNHYITQYSNPKETVGLVGSGLMQFYVAFSIACVVSYLLVAFLLTNSYNKSKQAQRDIENTYSDSSRETSESSESLSSSEETLTESSTSEHVPLEEKSASQP